MCVKNYIPSPSSYSSYYIHANTNNQWTDRCVNIRPRSLKSHHCYYYSAVHCCRCICPVYCCVLRCTAAYSVYPYGRVRGVPRRPPRRLLLLLNGPLPSRPLVLSLPRPNIAVTSRRTINDEHLITDGKTSDPGPPSLKLRSPTSNPAPILVLRENPKQQTPSTNKHHDFPR